MFFICSQNRSKNVSKILPKNMCFFQNGSKHVPKHSQNSPKTFQKISSKKYVKKKQTKKIGSKILRGGQVPKYVLILYTQYKDYNDLFFILCVRCRVLYNSVWPFPGGLEGSASSGRLSGSICTDPGTYKCPWSRVIAKNPPGGNFFFCLRYQVS